MRQHESEGGALALLAARRHTTAVGLDETLYDGETQPVALAPGRRLELLEDLVESVRLDADPGRPRTNR